jgi:hypothetical protein
MGQFGPNIFSNVCQDIWKDNVVLLLSIIFSILDWLKSTCIFHLICSMYYKYASKWFVGLVLRSIHFDVTT